MLSSVRYCYLLDVVIRKGAAVLELFTSEDQTLLIWWNALLVLDLGLDVLNGVGGLDLKGDGLARKGLDKDLHLLARLKSRKENRLIL